MDEKQLLKILEKLDHQIHDSLRAVDEFGILDKNIEFKRNCGGVLGYMYFMVLELYEEYPELYHEFKTTWAKPEDLKNKI
jgi:hypothetical protein